MMDLADARAADRTWGLPSLPTVELSIRPVAFFSVRINNLPSPAIDLLLRRNRQLNGRIAQLLSQAAIAFKP